MGKGWSKHVNVPSQFNTKGGEAGSAGRAGAGVQWAETGDPKPAPPTIMYNRQAEERKQEVKDTYDSSLQQSRFQFQSPLHF